MRVSNPASLDPLIEAVQQGKIDSTNALLMQLKLVAYSVGHKQAMEWASNEAHGYSDEDPLPLYRIVKGSKVRAIWQNDTDLSQIVEKTLDLQTLEKCGQGERLYKVTDSIYELEYWITHNESKVREWGEDECLAYIKSIDPLRNYIGWTLTKVEEIFNPSLLSKILGSIKTETIGLALAIRNAYPELTSPTNIPASAQQRVSVALSQEFNFHNNGPIGNLAQGSNFTQDNSGQILNVNTVAEQIQQKLGVTREQAREGALAVKKDGWAIGEHAKSWAAELVKIVAAAGIELTMPGVLGALGSIPGITG